MVWTHGPNELNSFITYINSQHETIKFTHDWSTTSVNFLDTKVSIHNGKFSTDLYVKPTDTHNYLHYHSCHPKQCIQSGPYSQLLRIKRICTNHTDFLKHQSNLVQQYIKRHYPAKVLKIHIKKVSEITRQSLLYLNQKMVEPHPTYYLINTFNPTNPLTMGIIRKHWHLLQLSDTPPTPQSRVTEKDKI